MEYYEKNKEHIQNLQRNYYHKNKLNVNSSCFIGHRLELQKKAYHKKYPYAKLKGPYFRKLQSQHTDCLIKRGLYLIKFT